MHYRMFDLWRFLAAMCIMVYHYLYFAPIELWNVVGPIAQRPQALLDLFFMISGYLVMSRYGETMRAPGEFLAFLRRRLATLYPLHLLTLAFFVAIALAGSAGLFTFNNPARWDLAALPAHLLLVHAWGTTPELAFNFPSWSISAEFFCYLLFPVFLFLYRRIGLHALAVFLLVWIATIETLWAAGMLGEDHWSRANGYGAYRALVGFVAGTIVAVLAERIRLPLASIWPAQGALLLAVALMFAEAQPLLPLAALALALFLSASAERERPSSTDALTWWSPLLRTSFGIYLWHMVFGAIFYQILWNRLLADSGPAVFVIFTLAPVLCTMIAAFLSRGFEAWAYARLSGGRTARQAAPVSA